MYMIAEVSQYVAVASFAEAWIEIAERLRYTKRNPVASFAEAWIEIGAYCRRRVRIQSPPSRRRGLKLSFINSCVKLFGRLLRGGVD